MRYAKGIALLGTLAMGAALIYGFAAGDFAEEGGELLSMPWGIVSLIDVYVGFFLFCGWIIFREASLLRSSPWVILVMVLGFFAGSLYTLIALQTCEGDWERFWMGKRAYGG
jgi:hypothetical protein